MHKGEKEGLRAAHTKQMHDAGAERAVTLCGDAHLGEVLLMTMYLTMGRHPGGANITPAFAPGSAR